MNAVNAAGDTLLELWHHGYDHSRNLETGIFEFKGRSYAEQKTSFDTANDIIKNLLGIQMRTFGTPYNASDAITNTVIAENPNYKVFMYSSVKSTTNGVLYVDNRVNMENGTGNPEYAFFVKNYNAQKNNYTDYMILQGHPNDFKAGTAKLENFKLIILFLLSEGAEFVLPYEYYKIATGVTSIDNTKAYLKNGLPFTLSPNPSRGSTTLNFELNEAADLHCAIYDLTGSRVKQVFRSQFAAGNTHFRIDLSNLNSGVYLCQLTDSNGIRTEKLIIDN